MQVFCPEPKVHFMLTSHLPETKQKPQYSNHVARIIMCDSSDCTGMQVQHNTSLQQL